MFNKKSTRLIHQLTNGNYRDTNKLLYTLFGIYEYYESTKPSIINNSSIKTKFIEMAAIESGFINA